jgi:hypothetical protein
MSRITFEIPQAKHPFIGMGDGIIISENGTMPPRIIIRFPSRNIEVVTAIGEEAKAIMAKLNEDAIFDEDRVEYAKNIACGVLGIDIYQLNVRGRDEKAVFGRWLVWDYAKNHLMMTLEECGDIFELDHSTVSYALKLLSDENVRFLVGWQKVAHCKFWQEMAAYIQ